MDEVSIQRSKSSASWVTSGQLLAFTARTHEKYRSATESEVHGVDARKSSKRLLASVVSPLQARVRLAMAKPTCSQTSAASRSRSKIIGA